MENAQTLEDLFSQMQTGTERQAGIAEQRASTLKPMREDIMGDLNFKPGSEDLQANMQPMPASPSPVSKETFMGFTAAALVLSAIAGGRTRTPMLTGLNAFSSGVKGFMQGAHDKFNTDMQKWQADTQVALSANKQAVDAYTAVLNDRTLSLSQKSMQLKLKADEFDDAMMSETIKQKGLSEAAKFIIDKEKAGNKLSDKAAKLKASLESQQFRRFEFVEKQKSAAIKPLDEIQQQISKVNQLLATGSPAADKQINSILTDVFDRQRATNLLFEKNQNFGSIYDRAVGVMSSAFTGRYKIEDREAIKQMMDDMQRNVIVPSRQRVEEYYKTMSNNLDLDPKLFNTKDLYRDAPVEDDSFDTTKPSGLSPAGAAYMKKHGLQ